MLISCPVSFERRVKRRPLHRPEKNVISGMRDASIHGSRTSWHERRRAKPMPFSGFSPHPAAIRLRLHFIKARFGIYHVRGMYHVGRQASLGQNVTRQKRLPVRETARTEPRRPSFSA
ncbi:hypothetical protein, partial [Pseudomonas aeruginosa]